MRVLLVILITMICCSCIHDIKLANGMVDIHYDTADTRLKASKYSVKDDEGNKTSHIVMDTKADSGAVPDSKVILIHQVMSKAPGIFDRDYLRTLDEISLNRILGALQK